MSFPLAHVGGGVLEPLQVLPLLAVAGAYMWRARTLARRGRPVPVIRQTAFLAGITVILVALASPVAHLGEEIFLAHMVQHLLLADIGALLIVLGSTGPMLAPVLRIGAVESVAGAGTSGRCASQAIWPIDAFATRGSRAAS